MHTCKFGFTFYLAKKRPPRSLQILSAFLPTCSAGKACRLTTRKISDCRKHKLLYVSSCFINNITGIGRQATPEKKSSSNSSATMLESITSSRPQGSKTPNSPKQRYCHQPNLPQKGYHTHAPSLAGLGHGCVCNLMEKAGLASGQPTEIERIVKKERGETDQLSSACNIFFWPESSRGLTNTQHCMLCIPEDLSSKCSRVRASVLDPTLLATFGFLSL